MLNSENKTLKSNQDNQDKTSPYSFRIKPSTNDKFKELASSLGFTQEDMVKDLIEVYELENSKSIIIDRGKEIEEFQYLSKRIIALYLNSLEINQNSEIRIEEKYLETTDKKNKMISSLQNEIIILKDKIKDNEINLNTMIDRNSKSLNELSNIKDSLATKEILINEYKDKIDTLTSLVTEYTDYKNNYMLLKNELDQSNDLKETLKYDVKNVKLENNNLLKKIELLENSLSEYKESLSQIKIEQKESLKQLKNEHNVIIASKDKELERVSKTFNKEIQELVQKHDTNASSVLKEHKDILYKLSCDYNDEIKSIKSKLEENNIYNLEKQKLDYERLLFEKDKEINSIKESK